MSTLDIALAMLIRLQIKMNYEEYKKQLFEKKPKVDKCSFCDEPPHGIYTTIFGTFELCFKCSQKVNIIAFSPINKKNG